MWWMLACASEPRPEPVGSETGSTVVVETGSGPGCTALTWFEDADGDGLGGPVSTQACHAPDGFVEDGGDCDDADPLLNRPLAERRFEDASADAGLVGIGAQWDGVDHPCLHEVLGGGGAVGDVDGDGDLDLFLARMYDFDQLLLNDGAGHFTVDPEFPGSWDASNGGLLFDADGDRDLDLYVSRIGKAPNFLYLNDGTGRFAEDGEARGAWLDPRPGCQDQWGPSAADVEGDGDLDLFVPGWTEKPLLGTRDRTKLLLNDGDGYFTDGTVQSGLDVLWQRAPLGGHWGDRDRDGDLDLHVVSDWGLSTVLLNEAGRFTAISAAEEAVLSDENGMGSDLADADGDGDLDWFVTAIWQPEDLCSGGPAWGCSGNRLYLEDGTGGWIDATDFAGVRRGQWGWGAAFFDYDLDGVADLVEAAGITYLEFQGLTGRFWRGTGGGRFEDLTCESGYVAKNQGRSIVPFDADGDGDLDMLGIGSAEEPILWRNVGSEDRSWLSITLDQPGRENRWAIGARVVAHGDRDQTAWITAQPSLAAGRPSLAHFGFGARKNPVDVEVTWPDGATTVFPAVPLGAPALLTRAE